MTKTEITEGNEMKMMKRVSFLLAFLLVFNMFDSDNLNLQAASNTVYISSFEGSYVEENSPYYNRSSKEKLIIEGNVNDKKIGLIKFDTQSIVIPENKRLVSAEFGFKLSSYNNTVSYFPVEINRISSAWTASSVTWNTKPYTSGKITNANIYTHFNYQYIDVTGYMIDVLHNGVQDHGFSIESLLNEDKNFGIGLNPTDTSFKPMLILKYGTLPNVNVTNNSDNGAFSLSDGILTPEIVVSDVDNDDLTCKLFLNDALHDTKQVYNALTEQQISFNTISFDTLPEGNHSLRFEVTDEDGLKTTIENDFLLDKSNPTIVETVVQQQANGFYLSCSANDELSGIDAQGFNYIVDDFDTGWISDSIYVYEEDFTPNSLHNVTFNVKDSVGNTSTESRSIFTESESSTLLLSNPTDSTIDITISDNNPSGTDYLLYCENKDRYITADGEMSISQVWIQPNEKSVKVKGLLSGYVQTFKIKSRNHDGIETEWSDTFSMKTLNNFSVLEDTSIKASQSNDNILVTIEDNNSIVTLYQIICGTKYVNGAGLLQDAPIWINLPEKKIEVKELEYNHQYGLKVKASDVYGVETEWSEPIYVSIEQPLPTTPAFNTTESKVGEDEIYMVWDITGFDVNYELEVDGLIVDMKYNRKFSHQGLNPNTTHAYRVRAYGDSGYSPWSDYFYATTKITAPAIPESIVSKTDNDSVIIQWDYDPNIVRYTIEFNGITFNGIESNYFEMSNLEPETTYNYKIKSVNALGESLYSGVYEATTLLLDTPIVLVDEDTYFITWQAVEGAEDYDVKINGTIVANVTNNQATIDPATIAVNTTYVIEVIANDSLAGKSAWSDAYIYTTPPEKPDTVIEVYALTLENSIQLYWKEVAGAIISYDILIDSSVESGYEDGILIENGLNEGSTDYQMYIHENIEPSTEHNYRFRANTELVAGDWSELVTVTALAGLPLSPKNVKLDSVGTITTLTWDEVRGATAYEIHVYEVNEAGDGGTWQTFKVSTNEFVHRGTTLGIEELYQIRTINDLGTGEWSGYIINNSMRLQSTYEEEVDLNLTASNILDFSPYTLHVYYNADVLTVRDLCGKTPIFETEAGLIVLGEDSIEITKVEEGHITFTVNKEVELGYTWEGIINNIIFEGNISGGTTLDYTVFVDENTTWSGY